MPVNPLDSAERSRAVASAELYLQQHKGWQRDQYRVEIERLEDHGERIVIRGVFLEDESHPVPGGGQSVELHVDRRTGEVRKELGFQ